MQDKMVLTKYERFYKLHSAIVPTKVKDRLEYLFEIV